MYCLNRDFPELAETEYMYLTSGFMIIVATIGGGIYLKMKGQPICTTVYMLLALCMLNGIANILLYFSQSFC